MKIVVNPAYETLRAHIERLPDTFGEGEQIYAARNTLSRFRWQGVDVVVKKYKIPLFINRIVYRFLRKSKAQRAYEYALRLEELGIRTPQAVAYIESYSGGLLADSYLVTLYEPYSRLMREFHTDDSLTEEGKKILRAFAAYSVHLHDAGVLHKDYSPGNIVFRVSGGDIDFSLLDINRMRFGSIARKKRLRNFRRLTPSKAVTAYIVGEYARLKQWDTDTSVRIALRAQERFFAHR